MLKKAGIIVAVAAAGVLAVAPLAFATDQGHAAGDNVSSSCSFANGADNSGTSQDASGFEALLGAAGTGTNANAPVTTQGNAPVLSCNNLNDIFNDGSKNVTNTESTDSSDNSINNSGNENSIIPALPILP